MKRILILEDNLRVLSVLIKTIKEIEQELNENIAVSVISEGEKAGLFEEDLKEDLFDVVLLDRYSKGKKDFHQVVTEFVNPQKVISISSMPQANQLAIDKGVLLSVTKDYSDLKLFGEKVKKSINQILNLS
jgi:spore coat polysaccharide biosynthesis predicted glycosyltransferase SpsG